MALFPFSKDKKTGYIDATGSIVIAPKLDAGGPFSHGVAECSQHNDRLFVDEKGRELFRVPKMLHYEPFGPDGLAAFARYDGARQRAAFRDRSGKELALELDDASTPREGLSAARRSRGPELRWMGSAAYRSPHDTSKGVWGYAKRDGSLVIEERFLFARGFCEGRAAVAAPVAGAVKWGMIDKKGGWVAAPAYDEVSDYVAGRASVGTRDANAPRRPAKGKWRPMYALLWGVIDASGRLVLPPRWRAPLAFHEGYAATCEEPFEYAFVDENGELASSGGGASKARFASLEPLYQGAAPAQDRKSEKWGLVDVSGAWILSPTLEHIAPFGEGLARFTRRSSRTMGKTRGGYLAPSGEIVFEYQY